MGALQLDLYPELLDACGFDGHRSVEQNERVFFKATRLYIRVNGPQFIKYLLGLMKQRWLLISGSSEPARDPCVFFYRDRLERGGIYVVSFEQAIRDVHGYVKSIDYMGPKSRGRSNILYISKRAMEDFVRQRTSYFMGSVKVRDV